MIIEKRTEKIEIEIRLSDYCRGCSNIELEYEETQDSQGNKKKWGRCSHGNACDDLYRRVKNGSV